ncbi:MAG: NuoM family protein [Candidatus Geothermarchaeales archaeon]
MSDLLIFLVLLPLVAIFVIPLASHRWPNRKYRFISGIEAPLEHLLTLGFSTVTLILSLYVAALGVGAANFVEHAFYIVESYPWIEGFVSLTLAADMFSSVMLILASLLTIMASLASLGYIETEHTKYNILMMLFLAGINGVFLSFNLIFFYIFWELVLVPMFFFILRWGGPNRTYAAYKFLIFTHAGSVVMLVGFMALFSYVTPNTFEAFDLVGRIPAWLLLPVWLSFFAGFAVKVPIVPLHTWLPDAHVEAPSPISVLLAGLLLKMGGYGLLRYTFLLFSEIWELLSPYLLALGILTAVYGAIVAATQVDMKRLIALTSISHMGFVVLGVGAGNTLGVSGAVFQMFSHGLISASLFILSGVIPKVAGSRNIPELKGLGSRRWTSGTLLFASVAAFGFPGLSGFVGEFLTIFGALERSLLTAVSVAAPAIAMAYFTWMLFNTIFAEEDLTSSARETFGLVLPVVLLSILIAVLGIFPHIILDYLSPYVSLFG